MYHCFWLFNTPQRGIELFWGLEHWQFATYDEAYRKIASKGRQTYYTPATGPEPQPLAEEYRALWERGYDGM